MLQDHLEAVFRSMDIEGSIEPEASLEELGVDSLATLELLVTLENEFHITIADEDLIGGNFQTVGALLIMLQKYVEESPDGITHRI